MQASTATGNSSAPVRRSFRPSKASAVVPKAERARRLAPPEGAMRRALLETAPRMPEIADDLRLHPRTLRRRLAKEGPTFDDLLDEVRRTMARELTDMPMGEIGNALAFASPNVFTDWFRRAFGVPPSAWPRQRAGQVAGISVANRDDRGAAHERTSTGAP
jgi:AraC-like DNA-binding protein